MQRVGRFCGDWPQAARPEGAFASGKLNPRHVGRAEAACWPRVSEGGIEHHDDRPPAIVLADTRSAIRVLETSHPPVYYIPPPDVAMPYLVKTPGNAYCEWKGMACYYSVVAGDARLEKVAWFYADPTPAFQPIRDYIAFYPGPMDGCFVDGERAASQPGDFYGGWITSDLVGPFKGGAGTRNW